MAARTSLSSLCFSGAAMLGLSELALAPLGFLALAARGGALVELPAAGFCEDPGLLDLLVETAKGGLEGLAITDDHFRQRSMDHPPFGLMRLVAREQNADLPQRPTRVMIIGQAPLP